MTLLNEFHLPVRNRSHRAGRGSKWAREQRGLYPMDAGCGDCACARERMHKGFAGVGATWVVRTHHIEYLMPVFAGEKITVLTWPANFQRVRSVRKYKFIRANDGAVIARAETDWVFINAKTGRPQSIPEEVKNTLPVVPKEMEPR